MTLKSFWKNILCLTVFSCLTVWSTGAEAVLQKQLLIINSYSEGTPWSQGFIAPILLQTSQTKGVDGEVVHLNGFLIRNDSLYQRMEDSLFQRYADRKPEMLVLVGNMAFCLRDRIRREWGDVPMLLIAEMDSVAPREWYYTGRPVHMSDDGLVPLSSFHDGYNFTFVETPCMYRETVDLMVRMIPDMRKLVFAADEFYNNQRLDRLVGEYVASRYPDLGYERIVGKDDKSSLLKDYLLGQEGSDVGILFSTWFYERDNLYGHPTLVSDDYRLIIFSPRPVFALRGVYLYAGGFAGGYFYDDKEVTESITSILDQIIHGKSARDIPFAYNRTARPYLNFAQLQHDHLDVARSPEGSMFVNRPPSFLQRYRWQATVAGILMTILLAIIIFVYLFQRKKIALYADHAALVRNMPVFYAQGKVYLEGGHPVRIDYRSGNEASNALLSQVETNGKKGFLSEIEYILDFVEAVLKEKHAVTFTHYFRHTDSFYEFIICPSAAPDVVDIFGVDSTARYKAENSLREMNKKLEMALSVAKIIPWQWDLDSGLITCEEQRILRHLKLTRQKGSTPETNIISAAEYFDRIHPDDRANVEETSRSLADGTRHYAKVEFRVITRTEGDEHTDWMEVNAVAEPNADGGRAVRLSGSLLLITERKKQMQALVAAREKAQESDRLKSAFLANMSHEIRTPLNAIVGFSGLLATTDDKQTRKEFVHIIEDNNQMLLQLIGDILDLAKIEAGTFQFNYQPVELNDLMRNVEATVRGRIRSEVILEFRPGKEVCCTVSDWNRLTQVLTNLLVNAGKFTQKGSVTFGYELRENEGKLYFYVRDTGIGISPQNQKRIFDRFTKLNNFAQGTGLGLSICQNIVEKMHGEIGVRSEGEGKGSTFWFTIPYQPAVAGGKQETGPAAVPEKIAKRKITLLVAEDNESNYLLLKTILGKEYELIHAWNGREAVELYRKHKPHIVIMDINMPEMDGYEATREIRKLSDKVPVVAVTAYAYMSDRDTIMKSGFNGYVSKPIKARTLQEELRKVISRNFILC